ncbi:MAG: hypothetical protein RMN25_05370 [Anaerolineae bacterium]|nr:hypothetical protein [Thermoflexales bacterium]MDW8407196.1 hypothetical protein [Anaerolineae bacterium]
MAKQKWQRIHGPSSIFSIAPAGAAGWLIGSEQGVWRLDESGAESCFIVSESLRPAAITAVAASPNFPDQPYLIVGAADGLARSTDRGETWFTPAMPQRSHVSQIALSPHFAEDGIGFAATLTDGVLVTTNHGQSWHAWNFGLLDLEVLTLAVSDRFAEDETVIAGAGTGVFRSTNGGRAWRELAIDENAAPLSGVCFSQGVLVAGSENAGLFYSDDFGDTWQKRSAFRSGQISALGTSPDGSVLVVATPTVVAVSKDAGAHWTRTEGKTPTGIVSITALSDGSVLAGTQEEGLWKYEA